MSIRRGLRIGFCGAGGTGKTTTATYISEEFGIPMLKSASRIIYEAEKLSEEKVLKEFTDEQKLELQKRIFSTKVNSDREFSYVADRTVLDHYAYCLAYCAGFMEDKQFNEFEELVQTLMLSTYSHVFYFPWGFWLPEKSDGVRQDRLAWQSKIDTIIVGYLHRWNIPAIVMPQTQGIDGNNEFVKQTILNQVNKPPEEKN